MNVSGLALLVMIIGALIGLSILVKGGLDRLGVPPVVGYLVLGFSLRLLDDHALHLGKGGTEVLELLAKLGVVVLLFRVGLESNLRGLLSQLKCASFVWFFNIVLSAAAGYAAARYLLGLEFVPSVVVATAMTATSVGIPSKVWRESDALNTPNGERFLDIAEMDDLSGVIFLGLLFAVLPALQGEGDLLGATLRSTGAFAVKLVGFVGACMLFSLYAEKPFTRFCRNLEPAPDPMLLVASLGFIIAAFAAMLGFSVAIGAFFAGLAFSRDPEQVKLDTSFSSLYELLSPFFFIGIGFAIEPGVLWVGLGAGGVLLLAAVLGKIAGTTLPVRAYAPWSAAATLGVSMIPRAEIAMLVMAKALQRGVVPENVYAGMVLVSAATCLIAPVGLRRMLHARDKASAA